MAKQQNGILAEIRRREMLEILNAQGHATVTELCGHFQVSPATIRNDLNELEAMKYLKRTHGGALSLGTSLELTSSEKVELHIQEKQAIAKMALPFIRQGQVIAIDTGTTTFELARLVSGVKGVTVITNDLKIALFLEENSQNSVIFLGGTVRRKFHCTVGRSVLDQMDQLFVDTVFLATNAMDIERGLSTPSIDTADVKRKILHNARARILLADSSKIARESLARFATIDEMDVLITDAGADAEFIRQVQAQNVRVIIA